MLFGIHETILTAESGENRLFSDAVHSCLFPDRQVRQVIRPAGWRQLVLAEIHPEPL